MDLKTKKIGHFTSQRIHHIWATSDFREKLQYTLFVENLKSSKTCSDYFLLKSLVSIINKSTKATMKIFNNLLLNLQGENSMLIERLTEKITNEDGILNCSERVKGIKFNEYRNFVSTDKNTYK